VGLKPDNRLVSARIQPPQLTGANKMVKPGFPGGQDRHTPPDTPGGPGFSPRKAWHGFFKNGNASTNAGPNPHGHKGIWYLFSSIFAQTRRCCVSRTLETRDGFQELQEGCMRFLKTGTARAEPVASGVPFSYKLQGSFHTGFFEMFFGLTFR